MSASFTKKQTCQHQEHQFQMESFVYKKFYIKSYTMKSLLLDDVVGPIIFCRRNSYILTSLHFHYLIPCQLGKHYLEFHCDFKL